MLKKCANPQCSATFHLLGEGRLYRVRYDRPHTGDSNLDGSRERTDPLEHFWLCDDCASLMTLGIDRARHVGIIPLSAETQHCAAG